MSDTTTNLALPYILPAQAQKHVTHNESLIALDCVIQLSVKNLTQPMPPVSPAEGDRYIVAAGASGDWTGQTNNVAAYQDGVWLFHVPREGWRAWLEEDEALVVYVNDDWVKPSLPSPLTPFGAFTRLRTVDEEVELTGSMTQTNLQIPNRAIVLAVSVRIAELIVGATSFDVGVSGEATKFGGMLGINPGDTNIGVIGPTAFYVPTAIELTATGGSFTAGSVYLALHFIECGPPLG